VIAVTLALFVVGTCAPGSTQRAGSPNPDTSLEAAYMQMYATHSASFRKAITDMATICGSSVEPTTYCVVAAEIALDSDLSFLTAATDASVPPRFTHSNSLLVRGLSHEGRGIYRRIESLRDRSVDELQSAKSELNLGQQLLDQASEALPADVRR
jgi:hypothetical protein